MAAWVSTLEGLHMRCERATAKTAAALQAYRLPLPESHLLPVHDQPRQTSDERGPPEHVDKAIVIRQDGTQVSVSSNSAYRGQAFEMLDAECIYDCRAFPEPAAPGEEPLPAREQQQLWKGDVNAAAVAAWGLEA